MEGRRAMEGSAVKGRSALREETRATGTGDSPGDSNWQGATGNIQQLWAMATGNGNRQWQQTMATGNSDRQYHIKGRHRYVE